MTTTDKWASVQVRQLTDEMIAALEPSELSGIYETLVTSGMEIDAQLAARKGEAHHPDSGVRSAYWEWRGRAVAAKKFTDANLMKLKSFMRRERAISPVAPVRVDRIAMAEARFADAYAQMEIDPSDPAQVLPVLYDVAQFIVDQTDWQLSEDEKAVMRAAQMIVRGAR